MNSQNILKYYGSRLNAQLDESQNYDFILETDHLVDIQLDESENYDFTLETSHLVDIQLDYSEIYDFELSSVFDDYDIEALISVIQMD